MNDKIVIETEPPSRKIKQIQENDQRSYCSKFRQKFFKDITEVQWNNWQWQFRNCIRSHQQLDEIFELSQDEKTIFDSNQVLPVSITPYYASVISTNQNLRKTMIPVIQETVFSIGEEVDPLHEENQSPVQGLIHRYPDRVLFLTTNRCSCYCRYCTRSRVVGRGAFCSKQDWKKCIDYIWSNDQIRDVILSGGDPLTLSNEEIKWLLSEIRAIPHVQVIRIGTKVPFVLPQRITRDLLAVLKKYQPLYMSIHATHPVEVTKEAKIACESLANIGIPLGSQTVLLKGVNDDVETMKELMHRLLMVRVRPYYLYQCDPIMGSSHFRTPVEKGIEIIQGLRGFTSGYAVPQYVIDAPGGGGKIPLLKNYVKAKQGQDYILENYEGKIFTYKDN